MDYGHTHRESESTERDTDESKCVQYASVSFQTHTRYSRPYIIGGDADDCSFWWFSCSSDGAARDRQRLDGKQRAAITDKQAALLFLFLMISARLLLLQAGVAYGYSISAAAPVNSRAAVRPATGVQNLCMQEKFATIVFLRHGQSVWNEASLFTGWADVELTTLGKNEAAAGATSMWKEGIKIDVAFTSLLTRAQQTLDIVLKISGQEDVPVNFNWRLNERMYGGLTGLDKKETVAKYGEEQVGKWRRSYSTPPPEIDTSSEYWPGNDNKYAHIPLEEIPLSECLKDTVERTLPYWQGDIVPALKRGKTVLVAAHGNSIRGILKYLDDISDEEITSLEIPTGVPLVYNLDKNLNTIKDDGAIAPLTGRFLVDPEELRKKQEEVANQSKLRYGVAEDEK